MTGSGTGGGQGPPEGTDPEDSEKCPICLSVLSGAELAMPDSCCHVFCLRCLLTWAEATPSCPVDRRPFTNVYRWDGHLTCVQVPVQRRVLQPEVESYCRRNSQYKSGLNSKRALRQRKVERTVDGKSKGLVRKCNDEDPSSLTRKKVRGAESCSWSPPAFVSLTTTTTHEIAQSVDDEDAMLSHRVERCKTQSCVWFSPAAPISATERTRESFSIRHSSAFPFGLNSSPFSSSPVSAASHFVFEGVVCAITCPKGGEKKASKAVPKQTVSKRSSRVGKTQSEVAVSEAQSPQTSGASDSESPPSAPPRPGRGAKAAGKRKGKRVTNRKASGKRKAPARKKRSAEVVSSSNEEEEEEATTKQDDNTEEEEEEVEEESTKPETAVEQHDLEKNGESLDDSEPVPVESHSDEQNESNSEKDPDEPLINDVSQESSDARDNTDNESDEKVEMASSPLKSAPNSPVSSSGDNHSVKDEEKEDCPTEEQDDSPLWDNDKAASPEQGAMDISDEDDKESTAGESVEKTEIFTETEAAREETNELKDKTDEAYDTPEVESKSPRQSDQSVMVSESVDTSSKDEEELKKKEQEKCAKNLSLSEDMNEVPMDFGSPLSEHGSGTPMEKDSLEEERSGDQPKDEDGSKNEDKKTVEKHDKDKSPERSRPRRSRFHSPTTSWSPKRDLKDSKRDKRSKSRERNGSPNRSARRSRERDGDHHRRDRSRERRRRRSRSRSRSRSRNRSYRRGDRSPAEERREERRDERREERREERRDERREESPPKNERRGAWWPGGEARKFGGGRFENGLPNDDSPERNVVDTNPDWVEKQRLSMSAGAPKWDDPPRGRGRGGKGGFDRGRGRGGGNWSSYNQDEPGDNRWPRNNFSGTGSGNSAPGSDAYSRFNENRGGRRKESDPSEAMDRSGWSSASSWAVRRTLPADVQDYYSKRERGGAGGWSRQEDEQPAAAEPPKPDPPSQTLPGNAPVPVLVSAHPQLLHHYPGARGPVSVSLQPAAPYALPPSQVPVHLHAAVPLLQVPAVGAQGLPPPPPPPPPMQQGSQTAAAQSDGHSTQMTSNMGGFAKPLFSTPTKVTHVAPTSSLLPSSTTQPQHHKAHADSSKKEKKQQIQERAINEVKTAIKPYYQKNEITKEEYKEIVRKAVEKVCHSKSGEVNSGKVANLVKAYVDKYKHARKK